jgi:hypothetical protein
MHATYRLFARLRHAWQPALPFGGLESRTGDAINPQRHRGSCQCPDLLSTDMAGPAAGLVPVENHPAATMQLPLRHSRSLWNFFHIPAFRKTRGRWWTCTISINPGSPSAF